MPKYSYEVWPESNELVRFSKEKVELFCPNDSEEWQALPHLEAMRYGGGNSVWFDPISEEEAKKYMVKFRKEAVK